MKIVYKVLVGILVIAIIAFIAFFAYVYIWHAYIH
jgi:hypothetical protein